jgi:hypothetical protein
MPAARAGILDLFGSRYVPGYPKADSVRACVHQLKTRFDNKRCLASVTHGRDAEHHEKTATREAKRYQS